MTTPGPRLSCFRPRRPPPGGRRLCRSQGHLPLRRPAAAAGPRPPPSPTPAARRTAPRAATATSAAAGPPLCGTGDRSSGIRPTAARGPTLPAPPPAYESAAGAPAACAASRRRDAWWCTHPLRNTCASPSWPGRPPSPAPHPPRWPPPLPPRDHPPPVEAGAKSSWARGGAGSDAQRPSARP